MRAIVVILGVALVAVVAPIAAQEQSPALLPPVSASPMRKVDFGLKQALTVLPAIQPKVVRQHTPFLWAPALPVTAPPVDCAMVARHTHPILSPARVITPPTHTTHPLKVVTVPPCPVR